MKTKIFALFTIGSLLLSCSSDDDNSAGEATITGTYHLTAFNIGEPQDLNGDGTSSTNQLDEVNCFDDSFVTLNEDHTFSADGNGLDIVLNSEGNASSVECTDFGVYTGNWSRSGNTITLTYMDGTEQVSDQLTVSNNTLRHTINNGAVVGMFEGNPVYVNTDIELIYTKN